MYVCTEVFVYVLRCVSMYVCIEISVCVEVSYMHLSVQVCVWYMYVLRYLYVLQCVGGDIHVRYWCICTWGRQSRTWSVVLFCPLLYCLEIGSFIEPEAHHLAPRICVSLLLNTGVTDTSDLAQILNRCWGFELMQRKHCYPLSWLCSPSIFSSLCILSSLIIACQEELLSGQCIWCLKWPLYSD